MVCDYICDVALDDAGADSNFTRGDARAALASYQEHGAIRFSETREQAKGRLIGDWVERRYLQPEKSSSSSRTRGFSHDRARSRAYCWDEDGLAGYCTTASHIIIL